MHFDINDVTVGRPGTHSYTIGVERAGLCHGTHSYTIGVERAGLIHIHIPLEWRGLA